MTTRALARSYVCVCVYLQKSYTYVGKMSCVSALNSIYRFMRSIIDEYNKTLKYYRHNVSVPIHTLTHTHTRYVYRVSVCACVCIYI